MNNIFQDYTNDTNCVSKKINQKTKIYLDTKYWVEICDVSLNKKDNKIISKIHSLLQKGVSNNELICPISLPIFLEVLSQKDSQTLHKTVEIIDELSQGYILRNDNLLHLELSNYFNKIFNIETDENYWDYVSNIFGFKIVESDSYLYQKKYFDNIKTKKLSDIINSPNFMNNWVYSNNLIRTIDFQKNKTKHMNEYNTLEKLYNTELSGLIEENQNIIVSAYKYIVESQAMKNGIEIETDYDYSHSVNLIYNLFVNKKITNELPSFDILAMLHSKLRWNTTQKYKKGDLIDIMHATSALAYYDYFFTEKSLSNMIHECKYDTKYNCIVKYQNDDILKILS